MASDLWAGVGSALGILAALIAMAINHEKVTLWINKIQAYFSPYIQITIPEYGSKRLRRNELFVAIEAYLSDRSGLGEAGEASKEEGTNEPSRGSGSGGDVLPSDVESPRCGCGPTHQRGGSTSEGHRPLMARKFKAELGRDEKKPQASVDDGQEIIDTIDRDTYWWYAITEHPRLSVIVATPGDEKRRFYRVVFHRSLHASVLASYLPDVLDKGRKIIVDNRHRRLFTNNPSNRWDYGFWSNVAFHHPATFRTLAMDPIKKETILDDLKTFQKGKHYYEKVGKAWKRGYLLFGPPGTGKSSMIAAIANELNYDIYDLELTAVKNNNELRKLFVETEGKSIIVIEDIDCSVDLTGKRGDKKAHKKSGGESSAMPLLEREDQEDDDSTKLTLSGVLNFIDGLWSACGGERIIIFTTNNKNKLDPALIRRGRMDKHIEMSYCRYEAFKVLASNYLDITNHKLFGEIQQLLEKVDMSPADVAEHLMLTGKRDAGACLECLVEALKSPKDDAAVKETTKTKEKVETSMAKAKEPNKGIEEEGLKVDKGMDDTY